MYKNVRELPTLRTTGEGEGGGGGGLNYEQREEARLLDHTLHSNKEALNMNINALTNRDCWPNYY